MVTLFERMMQDDEQQESSRHQQRNRNRNTSDIDFLLVLDFEATCDETRRLNPQEIIEFPTILLDVRNGGNNIVSIFHTYVRPDVHPTLSPFCTELTGISQTTLDAPNVPSLQEALRKHELWLIEQGLIQSMEDVSFAYVTCGDWDLQTCLPNQLACLRLKVPSHLSKPWINLKIAYGDLYYNNHKSFTSKRKTRRPKGMTQMLVEQGLELVGRHHSGIDDCKNLVRICQRMLQDGWVPMSTTVQRGHVRLSATRISAN